MIATEILGALVRFVGICGVLAEMPQQGVHARVVEFAGTRLHPSLDSLGVASLERLALFYPALWAEMMDSAALDGVLRNCPSAAMQFPKRWHATFAAYGSFAQADSVSRMPVGAAIRRSRFTATT